MIIVRGILPIPGTSMAEYSTGHPGAWLGIPTKMARAGGRERGSGRSSAFQGTRHVILSTFCIGLSPISPELTD